MFDVTATELQRIDEVLEPKLAWARDGQARCEQMALDASRLLSCVEDRLEDYASQGFFRRCWSTLSGRSGAVERANGRDLAEMQRHAWRYINLLQERDLLLAHSAIAVKNNLLTLAVRQNDMRDEITRLAARVYDRFVALEHRVDRIEVASNIHGWLLTIETRDYDEKYTPHLRLLRVVGDFHALKGESWTADELSYLQKALREVGLVPKRSLTLYDFVDGLIEEIEGHGFDTFAALTEIDREGRVGNGFVVDAISAPAFGALYQVKDNYTVSSRVIRSLQKRLEVSHADAMKMILHDFVTEHGIDTSSCIPLRDLAVELLGCLSLARRLGLAEMETSEATAGTTARLERRGDVADGEKAVRRNGKALDEAAASTNEARDQQASSERYRRTIQYRRIIEQCLLDYQDGDFYVGDGIPAQKERSARKFFPVDEGVKILGLIDTTFLGGCDEGMAICDRGIYWKSGSSDKEIGRWSWGELICMKGTIRTEEGKIVFGDDSRFDPAYCKLSAKYVTKMIMEIVDRLESH